MGRWVIINGSTGEDDPAPWLLVEISGGIPGEAVARVAQLAIAKRIQAALEWYDSMEAGNMSLPPKRKPAASKTAAKPKTPARARRK